MNMMSWNRLIPNLSAVGDFRRIHIQFDTNMTPERIRSSYDEMVDMGMKALVEEAAANSGGSAGAGKDWEHVEIRQCA